jgi:hypothetical protein
MDKPFSYADPESASEIVLRIRDDFPESEFFLTAMFTILKYVPAFPLEQATNTLNHTQGWS